MKNFANIPPKVPTRWLHLPSFACRGQAANRICLHHSKEDNLDLELLWLQDDDLVGKHVNFQSVCPVLSTVMGPQSDVF